MDQFSTRIIIQNNIIRKTATNTNSEKILKVILIVLAVTIIYSWRVDVRAAQLNFSTNIINLEKKSNTQKFTPKKQFQINTLEYLLQAKTDFGSPKKQSGLLEIEEAVDFASLATGVRKDFLMGMLVVESDLGRNVGKCNYSEIEKGASGAYKSGKLSNSSWRTFLRRKKVIKQLAKELGYEEGALPVSCNPSGYVGTGGAMGVGQFMPDTWVEYESRVAKIVKKENPDPWDIKDGVVAMALKLSDVPGVTKHKHYAEANAAKIYLSGTTSWRYNWYANKILYWSKNYYKFFA